MDGQSRATLRRSDGTTQFGDDMALLGGPAQDGGPGITPFIEPPSPSGWRPSRDGSATEGIVLSEEGYSTQDQPYSPRFPPTPRVGRQAQGPASATSLLRRLTTKYRSPISGVKSPFRSTKRSQGRQYATLDDTDAEQVTVDLSTLDGLGLELRDMASSTTQRLQEEETEYVRRSKAAASRKLHDLGDGMKQIGAQLRDPSKLAATGLEWPDSDSLRATAVNRSKTVRDLGQSLAQKRNVIVDVTEAVDLSSLEGHQVEHRNSHHFDAVTEGETHSYYFPEDPDIPNWRPRSMSSLYILCLTTLALGLAVLQEWLCQVSIHKTKENSGLLAFNQVAETSIWAFFAWKYLPTMVTIIYAVLFSIMDFDIRRLEPFYQLSRPGGARASASINLDHLTMFQYFLPFKAVRLKQWAVLFSTTGNIVASMAAPALQNPSIVFIRNPNHICTSLGCPEADSPEKRFWVRVQPIWSRLVSTSYVIVAIVTIILFVQLRRKSGLLSDPKGIAGIASMATKSHILQDFAGLDEATRGQIHKRLQNRRYLLYKSSIWQGEWQHTSEPIRESERRLRSPHPLMLRLEAGIPFLLFMLFGLIAVPLIGLTPARVVPNTVPWLPVLLATLLKLFFSTFEADVRLMEPFYQLSRGQATPQNSLTLDYQATVYGWMPFKALFNRHWLVALVGVSSVLLDVLTVTVSSFSVNSEIFLRRTSHGEDVSNQDETFVSFWASLILSVGILVFVIFTTSLVYIRRRHPFLPREPSTIAAVLAFIYASNMLNDFIDTERFTNKQMEDRLKALGKRYSLGWFRGRDGQIHCAIDEEPMKSKYVHGKPYTMAQAAPLPHDVF